MSQNGFDNGGISGVCKWAQLPDEVEFVLSVLERLARRYGHRQALMGIEIINEPNTTTSWPMMNVTERYKAVDSELAEGTGPIAFDWLKDFYVTAYHRLRDADKARCRRTRPWCSTTASTSNSGRTSCAGPMAGSRRNSRTWSSTPTSTS